jgi:predicted MFS family arabinose efflux permease
VTRRPTAPGAAAPAAGDGAPDSGSADDGLPDSGAAEDSAAGGGRPAGATFRDVFASGEFRALWTAQLLSVVGDQLARVAVTLLVYDRTRSPLLAAVTFAASVVPVFLGGIALAGLADRLPRRRVMIACDIARLALVAAMIVPGLPVAALVVLLFAITLLGPPFTSARAGIYVDVLAGDRYVLGTAITTTTYQAAQVAGFAAGGALVALAGIRTALLADAVTYAASALLTGLWVAVRPATAAAAAGLRSHLADIARGVRLTFGQPGLRTPLLFGWLAAFYNAPEAVAAPLARSLGGGTAAVGPLLAAGALGSAIGALAFTRLTAPDRRLRWMRPLAVAACGVLGLFALGPPLALALVILLASGIFDCYQVAASAAFVRRAPPEQRAQAFGIAQAGISLGQGTVMVAVGAAAQFAAPATVIAVTGLLGAVIALVIPAGPWTASPVAGGRARAGGAPRNGSGAGGGRPSPAPNPAD